MAHDNKNNEKVVYVGDSRVRKVNRVNVAQDYTVNPGKTEAFVPNFLLKEWMVGAVVLVGFMTLVLVHPAPLGYPADPLNAAFIPMPDWYFLFLYQMLKYDYVAQSLKMFGTVIIPGIAFGALLLAPWLDRTKHRRFYKRPVASAIMALTLISMMYLTYVSWGHYEHELEDRGMEPEHIVRDRLIRSGELDVTPGPKVVLPIVGEDQPGYTVFQNSTCITCHGTDLAGSNFAPSLLGIGDEHSAEEILDIIKNGSANGNMPEQWDANIDKGLTEDDLLVMADWLATQKAEAE